MSLPSETQPLEHPLHPKQAAELEQTRNHTLHQQLNSLVFNEFNGSSTVPATPLKRKRKRLSWPMVIALLLAAASGLGYWYWPNQANALAEVTVRATIGDMQITVTERADIESASTVDARVEMEGEASKIIEILPEGTMVTKGQVVVRFDLDKLNTQLSDQTIKVKQAEGKARTSKEELAVAKNKAESDISQAQLKLELAILDYEQYLEGDYKVELDNLRGEIALSEKDLLEAKDKLEKYRDYLRKGFGTPDELTRKEMEVRRFEHFLDRNKAKLFVLEKFTRKRQIAERKAKAEDAERELERTKSSAASSIAKADTEYQAALVTAELENQRLARIKKQLEAGVMRAPQDGILVYFKRPWDIDSRIQPGAMVFYQQTVFSIPDLTKMRAKLKIHESLIKKVTKGLSAEIRTPALPNMVLHGKVQMVATLADSMGFFDERGVKEYVTSVSIDDLPTDSGLKPGMSAEVRILIKELKSVVQLPLQAVAEWEGKHYVFLIRAGKPVRTEVTIGENNDKFIEIRQGIQPDDEVLLTARSRLITEMKKLQSQQTTSTSPLLPTSSNAH